MEDYKINVPVEGKFFGIDFSKRDDSDDHAMVDIYSRGTKLWFKDDSFSSYWIDDLVDVLNQAKIILEKDLKKEDDDYGYRYKG